MIKYGLLTADDEWASEHEVYDFLYALVRLLKPKVILETGYYKGGSLSAMQRAAADNMIPTELLSCETNGILYENRTHKNSKPLKIHETSGTHYVVKFVTGEELCRATEGVDLAFIDSSGDRVAEVQALNLAPNGVVVLHDAKRPQYQAIKTLRPWKAIWEIDTVQGITVFQS